MGTPAFPHMPEVSRHTISDKTATITAFSKNTTVINASCQKYFTGESVPCTVTPYPKADFEAVVDLVDLEPSTRYRCDLSAKNDFTATPVSTFVFSTRAKPI